jgi:MFS family permease
MIQDPQRVVSDIQTSQAIIDTTLGILLAVPFGMLADKYGRRRILLANAITTIFKLFWIMLICTYRQLCSTTHGGLNRCYSMFWQDQDFNDMPTMSTPQSKKY